MRRLGVQMELEMRQQPGVLAENSARYLSEFSDRLKGCSFDMVLLAARGSSDHAALYARYLIEVYLKVPVSLAAPSVLTRFGSRLNYPKTLCIGISQSGAAPDVSEVLADLRSQGHSTLAITNTEGSRLTTEAENSVILGAGPENSIAATKTYTTSLLACYQLVRALGGDLPEPVLPTDAWTDETESAADDFLGPIVRCSPLFALGRGWGFCTAEETALKLMECALLAVKSYSVADFAHGPKALADSGAAAICYGEVPNDLAKTGCEIVTAPRGPEGPASAVWEIMFGQWLALKAARARGLDPDHAQNLSKVTKTL